MIYCLNWESFRWDLVKIGCGCLRFDLGNALNWIWYDFFRYCLAIAILACLYTGMQVSIKIYQFSTGRDVISTRASGYIGFAGDQVCFLWLLVG